MLRQTEFMRALIISDIHSNLVALEAVLTETAGQYDVIWNLGDTIGYGPRPNECMQRMLDLRAISIAGNHDLACIGSNKVNIEEFNYDAKTANIWNGKQLSAEYTRILAELPLWREIDAQNYIVHGSPSDPVWEYLLYDAQAENNWRVIPHQLCYIGHSHVQIFLRQNAQGHAEGPFRPVIGVPMPIPAGERYFINPGSVGQPRDADPRSGYAILDTDTQTVLFGRVAYDIAATQQQMRQSGLPSALIERLARGR